jgi:2-hydroxy-6-oxonona-2,4-dienedioate hydrolase
MTIEGTAIIRTASKEDPALASLTGAARTFYEAEQRLFQHYGVAPSSRFLEIDRPGMRVRVLEIGEGPPVLMLHGGGGFVSLWAPLLAQLNGRRLIAVDRPGHGLTDVFDYRGVDQHRHALDFLTSVMDALELRRTPVIGNSMGGLWSLWLAIERPELVSGLALVGWPAYLVGTSAPLPMRLLAIRGIGARMMAAEKPDRDQARKNFARMGHGDVLDKLPTELFDCFAAGEAMPGYVRAYQSLLNGSMRLRGARPGQGLDHEQLRQVRQPVLLIVGRKDPFTNPETARHSSGAFQQAKFVHTDGGHLPWLDDTAVCASELSGFLAALD